ncbi:hypothetical protein K2173_024617 [Erythroxylum novogranatense]|uniref:CASP-like protein n=1 Tax=Erythroxylum novogranatense TaxID=1862640 RepID=A0AAV8SUV7_9ROSI|nr:hypothetical protein K2173_024617 [Erythroxylum novogranatense]
MIVSRRTVHPLETPPLIDGGLHNDPRTRMKGVQGMPGTSGGLTLRLIQCAFGVVSVCVTFEPSRRFGMLFYLVIAVGLQVLWSLSLALVDVSALLITSTLTFAAASASAGITVLSGNDLNRCSVNHCTRFETAMMTPFFLMNFWSLASP